MFYAPFGDSASIEGLFSRFPPLQLKFFHGKAILARLLPVLASINKENMQWVVATAIGQFCAAAMDFVANKGEDVVSITSFASDVFPAFEILFSKWTKARDRKVVVASLQGFPSFCNFVESCH